MSPALLFFGLFVVLAALNAGTMTTLQLQHYRIYPEVGRDSFIGYIRANNKAAFLPAILPALLLLATSLALLIGRPPFMPRWISLVVFLLNVVQLASSLIWQRRLQAEMGETGFDARKTQLLLKTNWIRTIAFLIQAALAAWVLLVALGPLAH
jgi:hypothetical protein